MGLKLRLAGLGLLTLVQGAYASAAHDSIRVIIKYKNQTAAVSAVKSAMAESAILPVQTMKPMANGAYSLIFDASKASFNTDDDPTPIILERLRKNPNVLYAVKDRVGYFKPVPEPQVDSTLRTLLSHESQWDEFSAPAGIMLESKPGLRDGAWAYTNGGQKPVVVAVLDTGIALNDSLIDNLVKDKDGTVWGWNFADNNSNLVDETKSYHGTHVAGTIAGYGSVMSGVGEQLKVLTVKIPGKSGMFYESSVINGIYWSVGADVPGVPTNMHPAKVLNMSFGVDVGEGKEADFCDQALQEAVFFARKKGAVIAAAAGNDNLWEHLNAPAGCNGTMKIASTGPEGLRSYFSNYGPSVSFAAPGGDKRYGAAGGILSTVNPGGGYEHSGFDFYQGTSMASPHVAGVAALVYAVSDLKPEQVEQLLYVTTHDFGESDSDNKSCVGKKPCGHGILDAEHAVKAALNHYDQLFSSPRLDASVTAYAKTLHSGASQWVRQESKGLALTQLIQRPKVRVSNGNIYADYGTVSYKLDQSNYKECQVIGFDGVGCYK